MSGGMTRRAGGGPPLKPDISAYRHTLRLYLSCAARASIQLAHSRGVNL